MCEEKDKLISELFDIIKERVNKFDSMNKDLRKLFEELNVNLNSFLENQTLCENYKDVVNEIIDKNVIDKEEIVSRIALVSSYYTMYDIRELLGLTIKSKDLKFKQ